MSLERLHFETRDEWLAGRLHGIGASEAAVVAGMSKWSTPATLWAVKTGRAQAANVSNDAVAYGIAAEDAVRTLFMAKHPELSLGYFPYDILFQSEEPQFFATLDGELTHRETGRRGILEVKTATPIGSSAWAAWDGRIPDHYLCQIMWQMMVTGWEFVYLTAELIHQNGNSEIRNYYFDRVDHEEDIAWIRGQGVRFWGYVQSNTPPPAILKL